MKLPSSENTSVKYSQRYLQDDEEFLKAGLTHVASEYLSRTKFASSHRTDPITVQHIKECSRISKRALGLIQDNNAFTLMMLSLLKKRIAEQLSLAGITLVEKENDRVKLWLALNAEELFLKEGKENAKDL